MSTNTWNFTSNQKGRSIWQLVSKTGEILGQSSQSFSSKAGAKYNAKLLGYEGNFSKQLVWDIFQKENLWHWKCHNSVNKEEVSHSIKGFQNELLAVENGNLFGFDSSKYTMKSAVEKPTSAPTPSTFAGVTSSPKPASTTSNTSSFAGSSYKRPEPMWWEGIWKWLLPLLLILLLLWFLWWILSGIGKPAINNITKDNNSPKISEIASTPNIIGSLNKPEFSTLSTAIKASALENTLNTAGPLTLLAPTDAAFNTLPTGTVPDLLKPEKLADLQNLLKLHTLPGNVDLAKVKDGDILTTLSGDTLKATIVNGTLSIGNVNGISTVKNFTSGNIDIYSITKVIAAPEKPTVAQPAAPAPSAPAPTPAAAPTPISVEYKEGNALATAKADGRFGTLLSLIKLAGLESALDGPGPLTIFAPTDEAFAVLGTETLTNLQKPENKGRLAEILKYHVVAGPNTFAEFANHKQVTTLNGGNITLTLDENGNGLVKAAKSSALAPIEDIHVNNAIIHVLTDNVLLPN